MTETIDTTALEQLARAVEARRDYIGETAEKSVTATCINILRSLRADTATVGRRPTVFGGRYLVEIEEVGGMVGGWARPPKCGTRGRRVVRPAGGGKSIDTFNGMRIINRAGNYARCHSARVFKLSIYNKDADGRPFYPAKADCVMVMAASEDDVRKFAQSKIERRIGQYRGVSKRALGAAMRSFATGGDVGGDLQRLADAVVDVRKEIEGWDSGHVRVTVADNLPHARQALRSGSESVALMRAANGTVGYINRCAERAGKFWMPLETPFPDVVANASRSRSARRQSGLYFSARDTLVTIRI